MNLTEKVLMGLADRKRQEARSRVEPTQEQELLLRAALREGKEALEAWNQWHKTVGIDRLDLNSQRLLPLIYRNLRPQDTEVPSFGRLEGTYRYTWYKNQILLQGAAACLRALHEAGVGTLVLKGAALISCYYKDVGSRFMNDFDILVRAEQASVAVRVLRDEGWQSNFPGGWQPKLPPEQLFLTRYSIPFKDPAQRECDLHVRVLPECIQAGGDAYFWDAAVPANIGGVTTRTLSPADHLLHVCVHGISWVSPDTAPPLDWIYDAVIIVTAANASRDGMDWQRLVTQARKLGLTLPLQDTLRYLQDRWDVGIPSTVLHNLQEAPVSRVELLEYVVRTRPRTTINAALYYWTQNARWVGDVGIGYQLVRFPAYLRSVYGLEYLRQIPFRILYALGHRIGLRRAENHRL